MTRVRYELLALFKLKTSSDFPKNTETEDFMI